ncbi:MAG TPA: fumarylacetoacetate hydrolase family protein [Rickettsiales bacterium]|nr:fumarylacetoacetate hydrolase family protein [Rickettsiales bacterium]
MKLLRVGPIGREKPALLDAEGAIRDLSTYLKDINAESLASGEVMKLRTLSPEILPELKENVRIGPCIGNVGKIVCAGLNYTDHATETGQPVPSEPILFMKATSAITGPYDNVVLPKGSTKTDWEVELCVIIGTRASYVAAHDAMQHVAGYCIINDLSERDFQFKRGGNWSKGKSADTFAPIGPYFVTADEISDPHALALECDVNNVRMQNGNTANMIFNIPQLISYISHFMTLLPGDIIATGTPAGVGSGRKPRQFLKPGDKLRTAIPGLGEQSQTVVEFVQP